MVHPLLSLGYLGAFIGPLIGVFTFYLVPWPLLIFALGHILDPTLVAALGASGATLGTATYYLVGQGIRRILPEKAKLYLERGQVYLSKYGAIAVFLFAASPLPDELIWIPVGCMRYDPRKALVACWLGKFVLMAVISYSGHFGIKGILELMGR
ncbi:MAG: VTT domain-containing protein [Candidatus Bathyarchaeia archaeon]